MSPKKWMASRSEDPSDRIEDFGNCQRASAPMSDNTGLHPYCDNSHSEEIARNDSSNRSDKGFDLSGLWRKDQHYDAHGSKSRLYGRIQPTSAPQCNHMTPDQSSSDSRGNGPHNPIA